MSFSNILNTSNLIPSQLASGLGSSIVGTIETLTSAPPPNNGVTVTPTSGDTPTVTLSTNAISPAVGYFYLIGQSWPPSGQYPNDQDITVLVFDNSIETAGKFTHATTATYSDIVINQTGAYKVTFGGTIYIPTVGVDASITLWLQKVVNPNPVVVYQNSSIYKQVLNAGSPADTYLPVSGETIINFTAGDIIEMAYRMEGNDPAIFSAIGAPTISGVTPGTTVSCYLLLELLHY